MNKKNIVLYCIILFLLLFLVSLYLYKQRLSNTNGFTKLKLLNKINEDIPNYDLSKYDNHVISNDVKSIEYKMIINKKVSYGSISIDESGKITINDRYNNKTQSIDEYSFKSIYMPHSDDYSASAFYAINDEGKVYGIQIIDADITKYKVHIIYGNYEASKFTDLKFNYLFDNQSVDLVVLTTDNKLYDPLKDIYYDSNIYIVADEYVIYGDNSISTYNGTFITDKKSNKLYAKYVINLFNNDSSIVGNYYIITTDNHLIYQNDRDYFVHNSLIKKIEKLDKPTAFRIYFDNNKTIDINGFCDFRKYSLNNN